MPVTRGISSEVVWNVSPGNARRLAELRRRARVLGARRYRSPGDLARALDPSTRQTGALDLVDQALVDIDAGRLDRLILSMAPQEGKSERVTHYGALWLMRRNPDRRIGIVSYEANAAERMTYLIRNDLTTFTGDGGTEDLGLRLRVGSQAVKRFRLQGYRGEVYGIGVGGSLTGRPFDVLIIDDPVKDYRDADSVVLSEQTWTWWSSVARPRLAPGAPCIVVMTRWHELDLAGRLLAKQAEDERSSLESYDRWKVINLPAQAESDDDPLGRAPGEYMESARGRTVAQWEATKAATPPRIWSALYQGKPTPDAGDVFQKTWWRRYDTPVWAMQPDGTYTVPGADEVLQSWDFAFKDKASSDYVVGGVWARFGALTYLVDLVRGRLSFTDSLAAMRLLTKKWPQSGPKLVEDKANGTAIINSLRKEIAGIIPEEPEGSKLARARAVAPFVEAGNVWLPSISLALFDVEAFIVEHTSFPNGTNDDQVDMTSQVLKRVYVSTGQGAMFTEAWKRIAAKDRAELAAATGEAPPLDDATAGLPPSVVRKRIDAARGKALRRLHEFGLPVGDEMWCMKCGQAKSEADDVCPRAR